MSSFLWDRPETTPLATLLLAHGAGTTMDAAFMDRLSSALVSEGIAVARFEFAYMAGRRTGGPKRPPPRVDTLVSEFQKALQQVMSETEGPLLIGGKSMGGRVAAMLSGAPSLPARVAGVCCYGYPFHVTGKPDPEWRMAPLEEAKRPVLILQGDRDAFGSKAELAEVDLPPHVSVTYLEDGDHSFGPRGRSPATLDGNIQDAAKATAAFVKSS